jgi:hypothetical protein
MKINHKQYLIPVIVGLLFLGVSFVRAVTGIPISSNFHPSFSLPIDDRIIATSTVARDAISSGRRYEGLMVFNSDTKTNWQLQGGITNSDWKEFASSTTFGGGTTIDLSSQCNGVTKIFTVPAFTSVLKLSGTQFPGIYEPIVDFTVISNTQIQLTDEVGAPEAGQTLIITVI